MAPLSAGARGTSTVAVRRAPCGKGAVFRSRNRSHPAEQRARTQNGTPWARRLRACLASVRWTGASPKATPESGPPRAAHGTRAKLAAARARLPRLARATGLRRGQTGPPTNQGSQSWAACRRLPQVTRPARPRTAAAAAGDAARQRDRNAGRRVRDGALARTHSAVRKERRSKHTTPRLPLQEPQRRRRTLARRGLSSHSHGMSPQWPCAYGPRIRLQQTRRQRGLASPGHAAPERTPAASPLTRTTTLY